MPKITRHGGVSNRYEVRGEHGPELELREAAPGEALPPIDDAAYGEDAVPLNDPASETEGGEQPSPGTSSSTSSAKPPPKQKPSGKRRQKPAPTTENRSGPAQTVSPTAPGTDGDQADAESATAD